MKFVVFALATLAAAASAEWIDFGLDGSAATLNVIESSPQGMILEVTLPGVELLEQLENGIFYSILNIPGTTPAAVAEGYPMLPTLSFLAAIPASGGVTITVLENEAVDLGYHMIFPMQPIPADNSYEAIPFTVEPAAYYSGIYPAEQSACIVDGLLRGVTLGRMSITPFSWNAETGLLTASRRIRVSVEFQGAVNLDQRLNSRFWQPVFNQVLVNADILPEPLMTLNAEGCNPIKAFSRRQADAIDAADLLIIAGDDFVDTLMDAFIDIKMDQGYLTAVVAAGTWTTTEIKNYIQDAYDNWTIPPSFVLFVGDNEDIPAYYANSIYSDNRYLCVDGSDYIADIFHGRFVTGTDTYPMVEAKSLKWQFDPIMDADFWGNVLCAGYLQTTSSGSTVAQRWFCFTCETVRDTYMNIYGKTVQREYTKLTTAQPPYYYRNDLPSAGQQVPLDIVWDGDAAGILASINDGVFLVQHRDHGGETGWGDPYFTTSHFSGIANGEETPLVFSINCLTGKFMWTGGECFAEQLICRDDGAVAVIAATAVSYSYFNDYVCYGMYYSFNDEYTSPPFSYTNPSGGYLGGQTLMNGMLEMQAAAPFNPYGAWEAYAEDEWDLFHFFGDPTLDLRTDVPHDLTVDAPLNLAAGATQAAFTVTDATDGPVELALVCLQKPDETIWVSGLTNASGMVTLTFPAITSATEMPWMITAHNALPELGAINGVSIGDNTTASITVIGQPFPNPSSSAVFFPVSLESSGSISLMVFDLAGRTVATVHEGELEAGSHQLVWNGRSGENAAPLGLYVARMVSPDGGISVTKIVLAR
jgi:hypothetical protein